MKLMALKVRMGVLAALTGLLVLIAFPVFAHSQVKPEIQTRTRVRAAKNFLEARIAALKAQEGE